MTQPLNKLLQMAQSTGGSPYDEDAYMPMPRGSAVGVNGFLANRLQGRMSPQMMEYLHGGYPGYAGAQQPDLGMRPAPLNGGGTDMDMMMMYGPEDQVAFDNLGRPIPLNDPRHPRNQMPTQPSYPQRR